MCCNIIMARRLIKICNVQNDNEMSNDIRKRNIPSMSLQPQFSLRPVSTKYAHLPIVDTQISNTVPIYKKPYNVGLVFNPGNRMAPFSGFVENVDVESVLRNQFFALQKNDQAVYVPSSKSDLYVKDQFKETKNQQHNLITPVNNFNKTNPNTLKLGGNLFYNHTRQDLKNVKC